MTAKSTTISDVRDTLGFTADAPLDELTNVVGRKPTSVINHVMGHEYTILGMTPSEFMKEHGGDLFSFDDLKNKFKVICRDFEEELTLTTTSRAVEVCSKVILLLAQKVDL